MVSMYSGVVWGIADVHSDDEYLVGVAVLLVTDDKRDEEVLLATLHGSSW